jgi:nucleoside phosphorylase
MLDEEHQHLAKHPRDDNIYVLGRVSGHNVVIACLPAGRMGNNPAATVAVQMRYSFKEIQFGLMVGIGGGVPSDNHDIRLGDVVVSQPGKHGGGVLQYDFGRTVAEGRFVPSGSLNAPPSIVLHAVALLQARLNLRDHHLALHLPTFENYKLQSKYSYQGAEHDQLFEASYDHFDDGAVSCDLCDKTKLILRPAREETEPVIHYGTIASGNQVMRHGGTRDRIRQGFNVLCFEMESAGLMDNFPCLVIRGISDYADSHKRNRWQEYAAAAAAAYANKLLAVVPVNEMKEKTRTNGTAFIHTILCKETKQLTYM